VPSGSPDPLPARAAQLKRLDGKGDLAQDRIHNWGLPLSDTTGIGRRLVAVFAADAKIDDLMDRLGLPE
jgi:hypothetical protein